MPTTLSDVAQAVGVSVSTVSRTLSGDRTRPVAPKTQERIWETVHALNYLPRESGQRRVREVQEQMRHTHAVGLVLGNVSYKFSDPFWSPVLDGIDGELIRRQYRLLFALTVEDLKHAQQRRLLSRSQIDGLILVGGLRPFGHTIGVERTVVIEGGDDRLRWEDPLRVDVIGMEKRRAIYRLVGHLASLGRSRIGFIGPSPSRDERAFSFPHALAEHGMAGDPAWVIESSWAAEDAYAASLAFFQENRQAIDALVCGCDTIAIGVMRAAKECGLKLPDDLAITGFDDIAFAGDLEPSLTTVRVPKELMGQLAVRRLLDRIADPEQPPIVQTVPTSLIVRASCGALGASSAGEGLTGGAMKG